MAEAFDSFLERGQALLESLFPGTLYHAGVTHTCANSGARAGDELETGGFIDTGVRNVRVLKSSMPVPPRVGERVVLNGKEMRLTELGERAWDVCWHLQVEPLRGE